MHRRAMLALLGSLCALGACGRPAPPPPAGAPRIVALSPALSVMLRDLGASGEVVGRHGWDMVLDKSVPVCGDQSGIDYETLLRVSPTHILLEWGSRPLPERLSALAAADGWVVANYPLLTLEDLTGAAEDLRRRFAPEGPDLAGRMRAAWSKRDAGFAGAGRVLLLASADPPAALGPGSFHHQILERIGGAPAIAEGGPYIVLGAEDVLRLAPDGIILIRPRDPGSPARVAPATPDEVRTMLGRVGALETPAAARGRLVLIDDPLALTPSSAMIGFADEVAAVLDGWQR